MTDTGGGEDGMAIGAGLGGAAFLGAGFLAGAAFLATGLATGFLAGAAFLAAGLAAGFLAGAAFLATGFLAIGLAAGFLAGLAFLAGAAFFAVAIHHSLEVKHIHYDHYVFKNVQSECTSKAWYQLATVKFFDNG